MKANAVHVWTARPAQVASPQWAGLESLLDRDEAAQADRFRFDEDRRAYVLAHALRRQALASALGVSPHDLHLAADASGKPCMLSPVPCDLQFSHSHTRRAVAVAVTRAGPVGIDIELLGDAWSHDELLEPFIESADTGCFHAQWTTLEAFWKAQGKGLDTANPRIRISRADDGSFDISLAARSQARGVRAVGRPIDLQADCAATVVLLQPRTHAMHPPEILRQPPFSQERR